MWWLAATGISTGWKSGSSAEFRGTNTVIRQDMAAFLHRLDNLGLDVQPSSIDYSHAMDGMVYITRTGYAYHRITGCRSIERDGVVKFVVSLEYAESHGYKSCNNCYH